MAFSFGSTAAAPASSTAPSSFSFGGGNTGTSGAAPTTSSTFSFGGGNTTAPSTGATSGGFSFGNTGGTTATLTAPASSSGFSFGGGAGAAPATGASTGGFGFGNAGAATATSTAPATSSAFSFGGGSGAAPATSSSFSFGAAPATSSAPSTGFGFGLGTSTTPASTAPAASGGLFGGGSNTNSSFSFGGAPAATGSSLFGGSAMQPTTTGGFGSLSQPAAMGTSGFGGFGGFGAVSNLSTGAPAITLETTFEQLPQDVQKNILAFRDFLKEQDRMEVMLNTASAKKLQELKQNMRVLEQELLARQNVQEKLQTAVLNLDQEVKSLNRQSDLASLNMRSLDSNLSGGIVRCVEMPSQFYWDLVETFEIRMELIKKQIEAVEAELQPIQLRDPSANSSLANALTSDEAAQLKLRPTKMTPILIQHILQGQNAAFMAVAAQVAEVHERADMLREQFMKDLQKEREKHGEYGKFKNPFSKNSRQHREDDRKSIDRLRFKTCVTPAIATAPPPPATPAAGTSGTGTPGLGFGFGSSTLSTPFGGTGVAATPATPAAGTSTFGPAATSAPSSGFSFGGTTTNAGAALTTGATAPSAFKLGGSTTGTTGTGIPKQVSFNLQPSTTPTPIGTSATGTFGNLSSPFLPGSPSDNKSTSSRSRKAKTKKR